MEYGEKKFLFSARKSQFTFKRRNMHDLRTKIQWIETRTIFLSTWWTMKAAENAKAQRFWVTILRVSTYSFYDMNENMAFWTRLPW